jgi:hypothetical protein
VGVVDESIQLVPVDGDVEIHADPPAVPDVRRAEEALRRALDEHLLDALRGGEPERPSIVVMAVRGGRELATVGREPGRLAVAQPLGDPWMRQTADPDTGVRIGRVVAGTQSARTLLFLAS